MDEKKTEHSKPWGPEYIEQAKALRLKVALVEEAALPNKITLPEELMKSWRQHVDLLKQVFPHPNAEDNIKVEILEYYPRFKSARADRVCQPLIVFTCFSIKVRSFFRGHGGSDLFNRTTVRARQLLLVH